MHHSELKRQQNLTIRINFYVKALLIKEAKNPLEILFKSISMNSEQSLLEEAKQLGCKSEGDLLKAWHLHLGARMA